MKKAAAVKWCGSIDSARSKNAGPQAVAAALRPGNHEFVCEHGSIGIPARIMSCINIGSVMLPYS